MKGQVLFPKRMKKANVIKKLVLFFRYCWVLPVSCIGLLLIPFVIVSGGAVKVAAGVIEAEGGILRFLFSRRRLFRIDALTIGHVIFGKNRESLKRCRDHEHVHVRQYERWGPSSLSCISCQARLPWSVAWTHTGTTGSNRRHSALQAG